MKITIEFDSYEELLAFKHAKYIPSFDEFEAVKPPTMKTLDEIFEGESRIIRGLALQNITSVAKLVNLSKFDILLFPSLSRNSLATIVKVLSKHGLKPKDE
jgi:DNA-directed RNA polymerase alpha subunit